jgi:hypothetical protein
MVFDEPVVDSLNFDLQVRVHDVLVRYLVKLFGDSLVKLSWARQTFI